MTRFGWVAIVLAVILGGWLAFDGSRALIVGDYVTPKSGEYAGRLGPWSRVVELVGLEARSNLVKLIHLGLGAGWLAAAVAFAAGLSWSPTALLVCAVLSLWYLPFGTLLGVVEIGVVLFLIPKAAPL